MYFFQEKSTGQVNQGDQEVWNIFSKNTSKFPGEFFLFFHKNTYLNKQWRNIKILSMN